MLSILIRIDESILVSTHDIKFCDENRKFLKVFVFLSYRKNFVGTQNEFELAMINEPSRY